VDRLAGDAKVAAASCGCDKTSWSVRDECVFSCFRSKSVRENRLWQSLQECRASFVSTRNQPPFTCKDPVCTYVRRAHDEQDSLAVSTSFGIVYTRAFAGDKVSAYAFSVCGWSVRRWKRWRNAAAVECRNEGGGQAGGKAELGVAFGSLSQPLGGVRIGHVELYDAVKSWRIYISARAYCHA